MVQSLYSGIEVYLDPEYTDHNQWDDLDFLLAKKGFKAEEIKKCTIDPEKLPVYMKEKYL